METPICNEFSQDPNIISILETDIADRYLKTYGFKKLKSRMSENIECFRDYDGRTRRVLLSRRHKSGNGCNFPSPSSLPEF